MGYGVILYITLACKIGDTRAIAVRLTLSVLQPCAAKAASARSAVFGPYLRGTIDRRVPTTTRHRTYESTRSRIYPNVLVATRQRWWRRRGLRKRPRLARVGFACVGLACVVHIGHAMLTRSIAPVSALSAFAPSASATSLVSPISVADAPTSVAPSDAAVVEARVALLQALSAAGYRFVTPTPVTHERVLARARGAVKISLLDIFGWNRAFGPTDVPDELLALLRRAGLLTEQSVLRSLARVASLGDDLFLHSGFPTSAADAVFFGPDTYRFARLVRQSLIGWPRLSARGASSVPLRLLDVGCGSGAGAIAGARALQELGHDCAVTLTDINPAALVFAEVNARAAGIAAEMQCCDGLHALGGEFDLIITNPPYLIDDAKRVYRHGGEQLGRALSVRLVRESLTRLAPGGRLVLYTGAAIVDGADALLAELRALLADGQYDWTYEEIDPDVFGEELQREVYCQVDRIAVVGLIVTLRNRSDHAA